MEKKILYVDQDLGNLEKFESNFRDKHHIITTASPERAWEIIKEEKYSIALLLADFNMEMEPGQGLMDQVKNSYPKILNVLITDCTNLNECIDVALSFGSIHFLQKPWDIKEMAYILKKNMHYFDVREERNSLIKEKF